MEIAALYVAVADYDDRGRPATVCARCPRTAAIKRLLGCGYDPETRGRGAATERTLGICPGWYRGTEFFRDALMYARLRDTLQVDPLTAPRRLMETLEWLEIYEAERTIARAAKEGDDAKS